MIPDITLDSREGGRLGVTPGTFKKKKKHPGHSTGIIGKTEANSGKTGIDHEVEY